MPRKRRVSKHRSDLTDEQAAWLEGDYRNAGFVNYVADTELGDLWRAYENSIIERHTIEWPGTRPGRWWKYSAPELRKMLGGIGTPLIEVIDVTNPRIRNGIPVDYLNASDVAFYKNPVPHSNRPPLRIPNTFSGCALDHSDPPQFESQAAYLKRLGLFRPGEAKRLTKQDFEPETIS